MKHKKVLKAGIFALILLALVAGSASASREGSLGGRSLLVESAVSLKENVLAGEITTEDEKPSPQYDSILYSEIGPKLAEIAANSNRVRVEVFGQSSGGRDMYLVTLSDPKAMGRLGKYQIIRRLMLTDPELAQEMIEKLGDFKVPVFINASIHGDEYYGVDAAMDLIETLTDEEITDPILEAEVQAILESVILLVNVVANPDGRVLGTRANANGFDLNRDFITQSQPETRAIARLIAEWNPMVLLDLHGFYYPMLIEPCTPLHNPNYEYDLYIKWALEEAKAMKEELYEQTGYPAQIPFLEDASGWDDWAPSYTPMYGMFHGAYGHTLETNFEDERAVAGHFAASWGALKFVALNRQAMIYDQIEIFKRGILDLPQMRIPDEILDQTEYNQYLYDIEMDFPAAYVIPAKTPLQRSEHQPARLVDFLLFNDVQVEQASDGFNYNGVDYPEGTYIVWMNQPKRGLANTILEDGPDLSDLKGITFYSPPSVWSNPLLWGTRVDVVDDDTFEIDSKPISAAAPPQGSLEDSEGQAYAYLPVNLAAFQATNQLLAASKIVYRSTGEFTDNSRSFGGGTFIVEDQDLAERLADEFALQVFALEEKPDNAAPMRKPSIAVLGDEGLANAMERLGFDYDLINKGDLSTGKILEYDALINMNTDYATIGGKGTGILADFFDDGGDYIGIGASGATFGSLLDIGFTSDSGNAIVRLNYETATTLAAGFWGIDYAFVNTPVWFTELGDGWETAAYFAGENFLVSGYWPGWGDSGSADMPAIVFHSSGASDFTLFGIDLIFRGHPENTFRLIANAIFNGLD